MKPRLVPLLALVLAVTFKFSSGIQLTPNGGYKVSIAVDPNLTPEELTDAGSTPNQYINNLKVRGYNKSLQLISSSHSKLHPFYSRTPSSNSRFN